MGKTGGHPVRFTLTINGPGTGDSDRSQYLHSATTISQGTLQLGNGGGTARWPAARRNRGQLHPGLQSKQYGDTRHGLHLRRITGSGSVVQMGPGILVLNGANTYGGGTTVSGGTLQVGSTTAIPYGPGSAM